MKDRTPHPGGLLVVAHRLSTVRNSDLIVVLSGGVVAEAGTYEALVTQKGLFQQLLAHQLQSMAAALEGAPGGGEGGGDAAPGSERP